METKEKSQATQLKEKLFVKKQSGVKSCQLMRLQRLTSSAKVMWNILTTQKQREKQ